MEGGVCSQITQSSVKVDIDNHTWQIGKGVTNSVAISELTAPLTHLGVFEETPQRFLPLQTGELVCILLQYTMIASASVRLLLAPYTVNLNKKWHSM